MILFTHHSLKSAKTYHRSTNFFRAFKKLSLSITVLFFILSAKAAVKTAVGNSGQGWNNASNWAPSGIPQTGDIVIIPAAFTLSVKSSVYSSPFPTLTIQIYGTLDFDPSGKIDLSSTGILNLQSGGQITSNGTSSELINIGGVTKFNGQVDGTVNGPRFASSATGTSPNGFNAGVLAIKIASFNYQLINHEVKLAWTASHDNINDRFEVQRNSGNGWITLTIISAIGNTNSLTNYSYVDQTPAKAINLYRIKLLNANTQESFSKTISVSLLSNTESLSVFPNPARSSTTITWKNTYTETAYLQMNNSSMNQVLGQEIPAGVNSIYLDIRKYPAGLYTITFTSKSGLKETIRLIINN